MAKRLQLRRGTTSEHGSFTGAAGEVTVDTDKKTVVVHDGSTAGGVPLATHAQVLATNELVEDPSPQLGADLDLNNNDITGTGGIPAGNLTGTIADARMPNLTGAITTVEGAVATTIANDAVDSQHYAAGSIDGEHIANDAVDSQHYAAGSIDNEHLADDAVGTDELANDVTISTSGTITSSAGITETGGVLKENLITNSGFDVWSNSGGLLNPTTKAVPAVDDAGSLFQNGDGDSLTGWTDNSGSGSSIGISGGIFTFDGSAAYAYLTSQACAVTKGNLYQIGYQVTTSSQANDEAFFGTSSNGSNRLHTFPYIDTSKGFFTTSTGTRTILWESTYTGNVYFTIKTGYASLRVDNLMMHEVTPSCVAADVKACDGWYKSTSMDIYRQNPHATYTKDGSHYSCKVVTGNTDTTLAWRSTADSAGNRSDAPHVARFAGRTVTWGAWVYTTEASHVKLSIDTSSSSESAFHGGGGWEWMEMTQDVPAATTMFWTRFNHAKTGITSYVSQPMLVFGSSIGEGNYTRPTQEVIYLEGDCPLVDINATSISNDDDPTIPLQQESRGKIPCSVKAIVSARMDVRDSASSSSNVVGYIYPGTGFENGFAFNIGTNGLTLGNDDVYAVNLPYMKTLVHGGGGMGLTTNITCGTNTFELDMFVRAIEI